jgi:hypothetical protein
LGDQHKTPFEEIPVSVTSVKPGQPSDQDPPAEAPLSPLSEGSRRKLARLAGTSAVISASLTALVIGIAIGNAARKRIDRAAHAYS